jgi:hypothetical protein
VKQDCRELTLFQIKLCSKSLYLVQNSLFDKEETKGRFYQARNNLFVALADYSDLAARHGPVEVYAANLNSQKAGINQSVPAQ